MDEEVRDEELDGPAEVDPDGELVDDELGIEDEIPGIEDPEAEDDEEEKGESY
jgi:hypothetical protein